MALNVKHQPTGTTYLPAYNDNVFVVYETDSGIYGQYNFKELEAEQFYGYALFFSQLFPRLLQTTLTFLKEENKEMREMFLGGSPS